ncbi:N-acetylmuramoyl-L-alanine amidase family protein [Tepidibacter formicigenes]|jgi:N-acetylmuramoyl-L-alanine amidase|uniref:N-acetylmuramoyl-L-alanine amidase n=1 Tax=Tepidibacter formicigenes DSM 15518 TaxID=1123349 RepID=A0A1M6U2Z2_9FIRM|nr:N-acetylmuramoyl-L-alanine amidase [Tepidibacter formicigenes]SHK63530.1 N-acetylmuramoyl-L-alanine amidase [Tepidibacter formicigenes DSM 15518]
MLKNNFIVVKFNKKYFFIFLILIFLSTIFVFRDYIDAFKPKVFLYSTVVIDPGHGGIDPGTSYNKLLEKDINLDVSLRIKKVLENKITNVIMTREGDVSLENKSTLNSSRYKKDLHARKNIIDKNKADLFISIHTNSNPDYIADRGVMIFYYKNSSKSKYLAKKLAKSIDENVYKKFLKSNIKTRVLPQNFYVLRETTSPGVLIEIGFITNSYDRKLLKSKEYKKQIAMAIRNGILDYINELDDSKIQIVDSY